MNLNEVVLVNVVRNMKSNALLMFNAVLNDNLVHNIKRPSD